MDLYYKKINVEKKPIRNQKDNLEKSNSSSKKTKNIYIQKMLPKKVKLLI